MRRILVLGGSGEDDSKKSRKDHFNRFEKEVIEYEEDPFTVDDESDN